jgi:Alginate export
VFCRSQFSILFCLTYLAFAFSGRTLLARASDDSSSQPRSGWHVSFGGETRWRYEQFQNPGFGSQPEDDNGYLLERTLFNPDWHFGNRVRVFVEFQNAIESGRTGGLPPNR